MEIHPAVWKSSPNANDEQDPIVIATALFPLFSVPLLGSQI